MNQEKSNKQYDGVITNCKKEFFSKNGIYGQSWHRYRVMSLLEKLCIKLERIKKIQHVKTQKVDDPIESEFPAIINYCIIGRVKCQEWRQKLPSDNELSKEDLERLYDEQVEKIKQVFQKKNHDYNESWRRRTIGFMVDEMLVKYDRAESINKLTGIEEDNRIEKFEEILTDICNYAIFCKIRIDEGTDPMI